MIQAEEGPLVPILEEGWPNFRGNEALWLGFNEKKYCPPDKYKLSLIEI